MEMLFNLFLEPWTHAYFIKGVVGGSIIAISCAVLGCYIILRKMAFIGDAMSHALLPGVGIGYLVMNAIFAGGFSAGGLLLGALIAAVLTSLSISLLSQIRRISEDTAIGIVYTGLFAAGVVILTRYQQYINIDLNHFFQGDIYGVSWEDMWLGAVIGTLVVGAIIIFYRYFTLVSFDPIMAASIGLPTKLIHILLTGMIAMVCVAGISMVGVIMIVGLLITPAALAYMLTDRLPLMMVLSAIIGVLSVVLGLYFSEWVNASGGGAIMFMGFILFLVGLVLAPRYGLLAGWLRRRRMVPQSDIEDVLKAGYEKRALSSIMVPQQRTMRAVRKMKADGLLSDGPDANGLVILSEQGEKEAAHILRSHQLWESHFIQQGMAPDVAHDAAEQLEHLHDRRVLDEFDEELDHPVIDAHGIKIPGENEEDLEEGRPIYLSLLRAGDEGSIADYFDGDIDHLQAGVSFVVTSHDADEGTWTITVGDKVHHINHGQADSIPVVRCI